MTGTKPKELEDLTELPDIFAEAWHWFLKLNRKRQSSGFGVNPLPYSEIAAYFDLIQYNPQSWEIEMIELFDEVAMQEYSKEEKKNQKKNNKVK